MLTAARITKSVEDYCDRVKTLYANIRRWVTERRPDAVFSESEIDLSEEPVGDYKAQSLDISVPGLTEVRLVPRGIFMVGARGRVDLRSRLGSEVLVWVEAGGPIAKTAEDLASDMETEIGRPIFSNVAEGWAWSDSRGGQLLTLTSEVLWNEVLTALTE